jgi:hypothetical protein
MAGATPPNPGVSSVGGSNAGKGDGNERARAKGGRRLKRGEDPLKNPDAGRKVNNNSQLPAGVKARVPTDIREFDIANRSRSKRSTKTYDSVDGQTYTLRTRDSKGNPLPERMLQCLYLAVREQRIGGDPFTVFDAFGLAMEDLDGKQIYPIAPEVMAALGVEFEDEGALFTPLEEVEEEADTGFSLGD